MRLAWRKLRNNLPTNDIFSIKGVEPITYDDDNADDDADDDDDSDDFGDVFFLPMDPKHNRHHGGRVNFDADGDNDDNDDDEDHMIRYI